MGLRSASAPERFLRAWLSLLVIVLRGSRESCLSSFPLATVRTQEMTVLYITLPAIFPCS